MTLVSPKCAPPARHNVLDLAPRAESPRRHAPSGRGRAVFLGQGRQPPKTKRMLPTSAPACSEQPLGLTPAICGRLQTQRSLENTCSEFQNCVPLREWQYLPRSAPHQRQCLTPLLDPLHLNQILPMWGRARLRARERGTCAPNVSTLPMCTKPPNPKDRRPPPEDGERGVAHRGRHMPRGRRRARPAHPRLRPEWDAACPISTG